MLEYKLDLNVKKRLTNKEKLIAGLASHIRNDSNKNKKLEQ